MDRFGRYHLSSRIFSDEMAEGYLASYRASEGDRSLIVKIYRDDLCKQDLFRKLHDESTELSKLVEHRNIVRQVDQGHLGANIYLGLEFHEGRTLRQLLHALHQQHVILPPEYAAYIALQLCEALDYLHGFKDAQGRTIRIVHQDICPASIQIGFDGVVRIIDGGMVRARNIGEPELAAASIGHAGYFGPERIKGSRPTPRSDVYAVGVVLWELLTGRRLFSGENREEVMAEVLIQEIESPRDFNNEVTQELEQVVMKAIDRRVLRRYATATVFKNALKHFLAENKDRALRAGLAGVMDTLFGEERDEKEITNALPAMSDRVTGRLGDFAEKNDTRPGPGAKLKRESAPEPWVKSGGSGAAKGPLIALVLVALIALGGAGWYVLGQDDHGPPVIQDGLELVEELQKKYPDASDPDGLRAAEGWIALSEGTPEAIGRARSEMELAVASDPWNASAVAGLALVYAHLGADEPELSIAAVNLVSRAQKLEGGDESLLRAEAGVALASGNYERAVEKARVCTRKQKDGLCEWYKGEGLLALGKYDDAKEALAIAKEALPLAPGLQRAYGEAAMLDGDYRAAADALESAVRRLPEEADVHLTLAKLHLRTGHFDQAFTSAERVLELNPRDQEARYVKGVILLHVRGDAASAAEVLGSLAEDPALTNQKRARRALIQAAFAALQADRPTEAKRYAQRAIDQAEGDAYPQLAMALAREAEGDEEGAEEALSIKNAHLNGRTAARYHYQAALVYEGHDHQRFARLSLESAVSADPNYVPIQLALGLVEEQMGEDGIERITESWRMDLSLEEARDPIVEGPTAPLDPMKIWAQLETLPDSRLDEAGGRPLIRGILQAHACLPGPKCAEARESLELAHASNPSTASGVYLAHVLAASGRYTDALALVDEALQGYPTIPALHTLAGDCNAALGNTDAAVASYQSAQALQHVTATPWRKHAELLHSQRDYAGSELRARKAIQLDPDDIVSAGLLLGE
ncbi:MAG: protein kinase [Proteobacteria bacterium]|nr:protein kinase [Pseudomonadota bacterium]MCP4917412.1 protein kinase [Pseudomonadota bacterium]